MQCHPYPERANCSPVLGKQRPLTHQGRGDGPGRGGESRLYGVTHRLEMDAAVILNRLIEHNQMTSDSGSHGHGVTLPTLGAAFDVGKEEGDRAGREIG